MQHIAKQNDEMRYIIIVIDVFSKFAKAIQVHFLDGKAMTVTFKQVLTAANPRHLQRLQIDNSRVF